MNKYDKEFLKELNGQEIYYKDIGIVMIKDFTLIRHGEVIEKITSKNIRDVIDGYHMTEYGTTNIQMIMEMEGF